VTLPATTAWKMARTLIPQQEIPFHVLALKGTLWNGSALLQYQTIKGVFRWRFRFDQLYLGKVDGQFDWHNRYSKIEGNLVVGVTSFVLRLKPGFIKLKPFNSLLRPEDIALDGRVLIRNFSVTISDQVVRAAKADIGWSGGEIKYPAGYETHSRFLPPYRALIRTVNGVVTLKIKDVGSTINSIEGELKPNGWATLQIRRRLLDIAKEPWPSHSRATDTIFKIKSKVLPLSKIGF